MWQVTGVEVPADWLDPEPIRVLYEFDWPRIFTCKDRSGALFLAYQCGEDETALRFLVVPFTEYQGWRLVEGQIDVREALAQPQAWLVDLGFDWRPIRCWKVCFENLPPQVLPAPGVMLWPELPSVVTRSGPST